MAISSRTPEGEPAVCPVCGDFVRVEPSEIYYDVPCPSCGSLLWFIRIADQRLVFKPGDEARAKGLRKALSEVTGLSELDLKRDPESVDNDLDPDSLDVVELMLEFEDEFLH